MNRNEKLIETERLVLRRFRDSDFDDMYEYNNDHEVLKYLPGTIHTEAEVCSDIKYAMRADPNSLCLAVQTRNSGKVIGQCGIDIDRDENCAEVGWWFNSKFWGLGFATEAASAVLRYCFIGLNIHRVIAMCDAENTASIRVLEKLNMRREGVFLKSRRSNDPKGSERHDGCLYAMLDEVYKLDDNPYEITCRILQINPCRCQA